MYQGITSNDMEESGVAAALLSLIPFFNTKSLIIKDFAMAAMGPDCVKTICDNLKW